MIRLARAVLWLLARLPPAAPFRIARSCAWIWMQMSPVKTRVARTNLRICFPELEPSARKRMLGESFVHYVCSILETGRNAYWPLRRLEALCDGVENFDLLTRSVASGRGVLVLAPHFGAWEYLGIYLQTCFDMAILYKPAADPGLENAMVRMRGRGGGRLLPATATGLRQFYSHVRAAGVGAVLPDQQPSAGQGRFVPFFGTPALTGVLAPRLLQKTGCIALFLVCERLENGRYRIHVTQPGEDIYSGDVDKALAAVNQGVADCIAIDPAQYLWSYKRFRARPEGALPVY